LATRATYSFSGFPEQSPHQPHCHLYLHHDGYPTGAAWRFAASLRHGGAVESFLAEFRHSQPEAVELASVSEAADADYRYSLRLQVGVHPTIVVQCWRRHPATSSWHLRCGPVPLGVFIQRFLPGAPAERSELSDVGPGDGPPETPPARG
jgi:hypothetical protein